MLLDALDTFIGANATPVSVVAATGATIPLGNVIDLLGNGVGQAPTNIIGNTTVWGEPGTGIGRVQPAIQINIGTAFVNGTSTPTATFALQYAADAGSPTYQPGTWYTSSATNAHATAEMTADQVFWMDITPPPPEVTTPRFMRLVLITPAGTNYSAGTVAFAGKTMVPDQDVNKSVPNNYTVS